MRINEQLFQLVPLVALLLNLFLVLVCLSAKKNNLVNAFMLFLFSLIAWSGGSFLMRMVDIWPGPVFWYQVSMTGILSAGWTYYNFIYYYTNQKGAFARRAWMMVWIVLLIANLFNVFTANPAVTRAADGEMSFTFLLTPWIAIPIIAAVFTIGSAIGFMIKSIRVEGAPLNNFLPVIIGAAVMFIGAVLDTIPGFATMPTDTLSTAINALILYYALYKKRLITLTHMTSSSPTYLIAAVFTTFILGFSFRYVESFYEEYFTNYIEYKTIVIAVLFSLLTILIFNLIKWLVNNLFVKSMEARDEELKNFSYAINRTLDLKEILTLYRGFIADNVSAITAYTCVYDDNSKSYKVMDIENAVQMRKFEFRVDNPMITWLQQNNQCISYKDFLRTNSYRAMWESEKVMLADLDIEIIQPIMCDDVLTGITLFSGKYRGKNYNVAEINYMESAAAIVSIGIKNALLYTKMQDEAQRDSLTNLYNRRHFMQKSKQDFELIRCDSLVFVLINFDDFRLYNELYGAPEGDYILKSFAEILTMTVGDDGTVARFGGKEFIISLPFYDVQRARSMTQNIQDRLKQSLASIADHGKRYLTFSAGICAYPTSASNLDELVTYVNMAVYAAKRNGKNRIEVYTPVSPEDQKKLDTKSKRQIAENSAQTIFALTAAIDAKDHYTFNHSNNVSEYATKLAKELGLDAEHVEIIRQAGLMHDIGKIGIPDAILSKKSRLTDEEYEIMKQHVEGSIAMIRHIPALDYVVPAAIGHHERWDGGGYPRGLAGEEIPLAARILCLADSFDAMTTKRPYRDGLTFEEALPEIEDSLGKQFDPEIGKVFADMIRRGVISPPVEAHTT